MLEPRFGTFCRPYSSRKLALSGVAALPSQLSAARQQGMGGSRQERRLITMPSMNPASCIQTLMHAYLKSFIHAVLPDGLSAW